MAAGAGILGSEKGGPEAGDWPLKRWAQHEGPGRLLAILLTGGEAHDCPVAERLIATGKASKRLIGDKAGDSTELRLWLKDRGKSYRHALRQAGV